MKTVQLILISCALFLGLSETIPGSSAAAQVSLEGVVDVTSLNIQQNVSCKVLYFRWLNQDVRSFEEAKLIEKFRSGKTLSNAEVRDLQIVASRLASLIPGARENNHLILARWQITGLAPEVQQAFESKFNLSELTVSVADQIWHSTNGFLPDDVSVTYSKSTGVIELKFATNPVDACFGERAVHADFIFPTGQIVNLYGQLPKSNLRMPTNVSKRLAGASNL